MRFPVEFQLGLPAQQLPMPPKQFQHRFTLLHNQASVPRSVPTPSLHHQDAIVQHVQDNNITQPDLRQNYHVRFLLNFIQVVELSHPGGILGNRCARGSEDNKLEKEKSGSE